jgi:hypothetical protein
METANWVKVKDANYWRRDAEREALVRSRSVGRELACSALNAVRVQIPDAV